MRNCSGEAPRFGGRLQREREWRAPWSERKTQAQKVHSGVQKLRSCDSFRRAARASTGREGSRSHRNGAAGVGEARGGERRQGPAGALTTRRARGARQLRREVKRLRMEREISKKSDGLLREGERVRFAFIDAEKASYPVVLLCQVLEVSRSGYYAGAAPPRARARARRRAARGARSRRSTRRAGSTTAAPRPRRARAAGSASGRKRVARLMREHGIAPARSAASAARPTRDTRYPSPPNLLGAALRRGGPNQRWVTDITYICDRRGLALPGRDPRPVLAPRRRLGNERRTTTASSRSTRSNDGAARRAARRRPRSSLRPRQPVRQRRLPRAPRRARHRSQHERHGDCWDNAVAESFFATLKAELVDRDFATRAAAEIALFDYIERFYNRRRRHSSLGYATPIEFENTFVRIKQAA